MDQAEIILGLTFDLIEDRNASEHIRLPPGLIPPNSSSLPLFSLYRLTRHLKPKKILCVGENEHSLAFIAAAQGDNGDSANIYSILPGTLPRDSKVKHLSEIEESGLVNDGAQVHIGNLQKIILSISSNFDFILVNNLSHVEDVTKVLSLLSSRLVSGGHMWIGDYTKDPETHQATNNFIQEEQQPFAVNQVPSTVSFEGSGWAIIRKINEVKEDSQSSPQSSHQSSALTNVSENVNRWDYVEATRFRGKPVYSVDALIRLKEQY